MKPTCSFIGGGITQLRKERYKKILQITTTWTCDQLPFVQPVAMAQQKRTIASIAVKLNVSVIRIKRNPCFKFMKYQFLDKNMCDKHN